MNCGSPGRKMAKVESDTYAAGAYLRAPFPILYPSFQPLRSPLVPLAPHASRSNRHSPTGFLCGLWASPCVQSPWRPHAPGRPARKYAEGLGVLTVRPSSSRGPVHVPPAFESWNPIEPFDTVPGPRPTGHELGDCWDAHAFRLPGLGKFLPESRSYAGTLRPARD